MAFDAMKEIRDLKNGLSMGGGDWGSLAQLFFDNLSTLLGSLYAVQGLRAEGVSQEALDNVLFGKIVPGVGITLVLGNLYYSWQAIRLTNKYGRQYTAQPYGLNTPAALAFVFNIMYSVYFEEVSSKGQLPDEAFYTAYKVTLAANFITGLMSCFLGIFGRLIIKVVPPAALLVPIAGIGIAFLGLEQISHSIAAPIVGYNAMIWVFLGWYAGIRIGYGNIRIPEALQVMIIGIILGWATGLNSVEEFRAGKDLVKWWGPTWSATDLFSRFDLVKDYLGIIVPIGISAASTTLMCLVSAKEAGDPFPVRESMIVDGIGTMASSFFGSPFGTVLYIGHPVHKRNGAKVGYSLVNGVVYLIFSWFGILALIQAIVNRATIGPIVLFVGLMINEEALNFMPSRHYAAYIVGLFPSIYDWVVNATGENPLDNGNGYNENFPTGVSISGFVGILAWKQGSLLVSLVWTAMLVMALDRKWIPASAWAGVGSILAAFGIIHAPIAGVDSFNEVVSQQCISQDDGASIICWEHAVQWKFFFSYLMMSFTFIIINFAKRFDSMIGDEVESPSQDAFIDWFKDAAKGANEDDGERSIYE